MKKLFKWLLFLIIVLAVGVVVLVYNPGLIKGPLERYLGNLAGYSISLEGELEIDAGRLIELTAQNIHIAAPDWSTRSELVAVGRLSLVLNTASLFKDTVVIESLQLNDLQLNLETTADGANNWVRATKPSHQANRHDTDPVVSLSNIQLSNVTVRHRNGGRGIEHVFQIDSFRQNQRSDGMLTATLRGDLNDRPVEYTGTFGPYVNLLNGRDISYTASGHFGELIIDSNGLIDDLLSPRHPRFILNIQGPNIDEITSMLGVDDLGSGGFSLRAKGARVNGVYETDINAKVGDISLIAAAQASDLAQLNEFDLNLAINGPSLDSFTDVFGIEHWPDKPFSLKLDAERVGGTLNISELTLNIGGTRLLLDALLTDFPNLDASRIKLSVSGDDVTQFHELLGISGIATGPFNLHGKLDVSPEGLELLQIELNTSLGQATLSGTLGPAPAYTGSKLQLHLDGDNAHSLMSVFAIDALPEQPFNLNTRLELVENGVLVERGVLVTIENERLELGGLIALNPGIKGTDVEVRISGQHLARVLRRLVGDTEIPDGPYDLSGRVRVMEEGIVLEDVRAGYADIELAVAGLIGLDAQLGLDFRINGQNLSSLGNFSAIGDSLDIFVPGQSYQATGHFALEVNGWRLDDINGRIGKTDFSIDGLVSNQAGLVGSNIRFSVKGPDLNSLLVGRDKAGLPPGAFKSSGQLMLTSDSLNVYELVFESTRAHGEIKLDLGWPITRAIDADFNINLWGDDIRHLLPRIDSFEPEKAAFKLTTAGRLHGDQIALQQFDAGVGKLQISLKGKVDNDPTDEKADISLSIVSEDISALGQLNGQRLPALALDLKADFEGNVRRFVIRNLVGTLGKSQLEGTLDVSLTGAKPRIKLIAKSNYIDIRPFLELNKPESDDEAVAATGQERLIPATPLPLDALAAADIAIKLDITELIHRRDSIKNLVLETEIQSGSLRVPQFSFEASRGKLNTSLSISPTVANKAEVKIDLQAEDFVFNLGGYAGQKLLQVPAFDIDLHASGKGGNLQEVAGTLNGSMYLGSTGGTLEGVDLSILDTFILDDIFSLIMPESSHREDVQLSCAAGILEVKNGLVETTPAIAFTTGRITVITKGTLDLKTEKMNLSFNATPNNALQISAGELINPYILISGTLTDPVVGLDPAMVLLHGGAAVGTAGISILAKGLFDRMNNTIPLCEEMLKQAPDHFFVE